MKALDEYFLMVVFMLLLNRVHVFANVMFNLEKHGSEKVNCDVAQKRWTHHLRSHLPKARSDTYSDSSLFDSLAISPQGLFKLREHPVTVRSQCIKRWKIVDFVTVTLHTIVCCCLWFCCCCHCC